jgi:ribonuclease Z
VTSVSVRELVVLGTACQVPTRHRAHNGYLLRWDRDAILFDPGEGTQRQLTFAGVSASSITRICITHLHGDHCLGLPGVLHRLGLDGVEHPVHVHYPASGQPQIDALRSSTVSELRADVRLHPAEPGVLVETDGWRLEAHELAHRVDTLGYRLVEPDGVTLLPQRLDAAGVHGADRARLVEQDEVVLAGRRVRVEDVSVPRAGQRFAFVMDTEPCDGAVAAAQDADLLVAESTFLDEDRDVAATYRHLTAGQAGELAAAAGARHLVLTHFSQRYPLDAPFGDQARAAFDGVVTVAQDLDRVAIPREPRPVDAP